MAEFLDRVVDVLRTEGADVAETVGLLVIGAATLIGLLSLPWPLAIVLGVCVGVRLYRLAEKTSELERYRRERS